MKRILAGFPFLVMLLMTDTAKGATDTIKGVSDVAKINFVFDYNSFFSAIIGGALTIVATCITLHYENKKSIKVKKSQERELRGKFFMELNYNKRKVIYTIENNIRLTYLDNLHWKNFIFSEASNILINDRELVEELATLDSMVDHANELIQLIKESEAAIICNTGHNGTIGNTTKKLYTAQHDYAKDFLKPQMDKVIPKLEKLFKRVNSE